MTPPSPAPVQARESLREETAHRSPCDLLPAREIITPLNAPAHRVDAPPAPSPLRSLRLLVGGQTIEVASLPHQGRYVLGRGTEAQVVVRDNTVSRLHAALTYGPSGLSLTDLGSANGTRIGVQPLVPNEACVLPLSQLFSLGDVIAVVYEGPSTAQARWAVGREALATDLEQLLRTNLAVGRGNEQPLTVGALRGEQVARWLPVVVGLAPPSATLAVTGENVMSILLPGIPRAAAIEWFEAVASCLKDDPPTLAGIVATDIRSFPEDGAVLVDLFPHESNESTKPRKRAPAPVVATSAPMAALFERADRATDDARCVLIVGERGVGKQRLARRLHDRSPRTQGPFVVFDCAALPEDVVDGELFGYEAGAVPGTTTGKAGVLDAARGGTLVLREVGALPEPTQVKLLRVLEQRAVVRLGGNGTHPVDVRWIATSSADLATSATDGTFLPELYARLNAVSMPVPPLRERHGEIASLITLFAAGAAELLERATPRFSPDVIATLERQPWRGNLRELRSTVERMVIEARGVITVDNLPPEMRAARPPSNPSLERFAPPNATVPPRAAAGSTADSLDDAMAEIERRKIQDALDQCAGNQTRAAQVLGITRRALVGRMEKYNLPRPRR